MLAGSTDWRHRRQRLSGRSASTGPGPARVEAQLTHGRRQGRGAELLSNNEAASRVLIKREYPIQPPARPHPAGKNGDGRGGATERRSARGCRRAGASRDRDSASPVRRARRSLRARRMGDRRAGAPRSALAEGLGTAGTRPGPRSRGEWPAPRAGRHRGCRR